MPTIPHEELRSDIGDVLRRAEAGERFTITVAGRPVAQLGPESRREWVSGPQLWRIWDSQAPTSLAADLEDFAGDTADPYW